MPARIGSLFSGYGGLELGIAEVLDADTAWHVEFDAAPSRILEHHWPGVPNLGDVTAVDWSAVEPVEILCGGFPCQDVSTAGLRRGLKPGTRSGLWSHFAAAIDALRPPLVIIENVRGLLSAEAHSDVEPDPWDLGAPGGTDRPVLRALGAVLGDLADLGYDAEWLGLRAADAGAPHRRFRVFIIARPAPDTDDSGLGGQRSSGRGREPDAHRSGDRIPAGGRRAARLAADAAAPDTSDDGRGAVATLDDHDGTIALRDQPDRRAAPDADGRRHGSEQDARGVGRLDRRDAGPARERERARRVPRDRSTQADRRIGWGQYGPAIARWEAVLGRTAPAPTEAAPVGGERLAPPFVEWMMGLPAGHVTDPAIGLTRSEQLKALGNGVVPQQAALALRTLLTQP